MSITTTLQGIVFAARMALADIKELKKDCPGKFNDYCCNWADLKVVDVRYYQSVDGGDGFQVLIEEAKCPLLEADMRERLKTEGITAEVITEW